MSGLIPNPKYHYIVATPSDDETCQTYILHNEDHTLGNALRYVIMKNPNVEFCGYSVPHPSESKINFRIQTRNVPAADVLKQGLMDLGKVCDHVLQTFQSSVAAFRKAREGVDDVMKSEDEDEEDEQGGNEGKMDDESENGYAEG